MDSFTNMPESSSQPHKEEDTAVVFRFMKTGAAIVLGSLVYAAALHFFIFPYGILLGGTGGVSVLLNRLLPRLSPENYLVIINTLLMVAAVVMLGKGMAGKTMLGSFLTTVFIGAMDSAAPGSVPLIGNVFISAGIGAVVVAIGSTMLFCVDSSSGGTDIIALIIQKYARIQTGRALLISDILIVLLGITFCSWTVAAASLMGLLIKTFGIDLLIQWFHRLLRHFGKEPKPRGVEP